MSNATLEECPLANYSVSDKAKGHQRLKGNSFSEGLTHLLKGELLLAAQVGDDCLHRVNVLEDARVRGGLNFDHLITNIN